MIGRIRAEILHRTRKPRSWVTRFSRMRRGTGHSSPAVCLSVIDFGRRVSRGAKKRAKKDARCIRFRFAWRKLARGAAERKAERLRVFILLRILRVKKRALPVRQTEPFKVRGVHGLRRSVYSEFTIYINEFETEEQRILRNNLIVLRPPFPARKTPESRIWSEGTRLATDEGKARENGSATVQPRP
jgi:hypothetical protein